MLTMDEIRALPKVRVVASDDDSGCALTVRIARGVTAEVIASWGMGWDHVSVVVIAAGRARTPTWGEMVTIKRMLFRPDEWAMELHPPETENISIHPHCLHLWRPHGAAIPTPPRIMV